jgi:hypothetical protein
MKCEEFENQLHEVLDRRESLVDDPFLTRHAKGCAGCQRKIDLYEALFDGLELTETPSLAADFSKQITRAAKVRRRTAWKPIIGVCVTLAASLLVMVAIANRSGSPNETPGEGTVAESNATAKPTKTRTGNGGSLTAIAQGSKASTADDVAHNQTSPKELDELIKDLQLASQGMSLAETSAATTRLPGFRPLASSLNSAFSALKQTLPGGRSDEEQPTKPQAGYFPAVDARNA